MSHHVELVNRAQQGDRQALEELLAQFWPTAFRIAVRILRNPDHAEEVAQQVAITAIKRIGTINSPEGFPGWFQTTARHEAFAERKRIARYRNLLGGFMTHLE